MGNLANDCESVGILCAGDDRDARFDDACFLEGNFGQGAAEPLLVIVLDVGNHARDRSDNVRGIEPATQPRFPNDNIALLLRKIFERHDRDRFEEGWVAAGWKCGKPRTNLGDQPDDVIFRDRGAIDLKAFREADEVRRGKESCFEARRTIDAFEHRTGGAFAVRARDMNEAKALVRISREFGQAKGVVQAEVRAEQSQGVEILDSFGVRHRSILAQTSQRWEAFCGRPFLAGQRSVGAIELGRS